MATFDDTPKWKREMRWDPVAQRMLRPARAPTRKQVDYLRKLCAARGVKFERPQTRDEARRTITRLRRRGGTKGRRR